MIKQESFKILKQIADFYEKFTFDQEKVNSWHQVLQYFSYDKVQENLYTYVPRSKEAPCVYDLVRKPWGSSTIPNVEETAEYLNRTYVPASEEQVQKHLAKIRAILKIETGATNEQV